MDVTSTPETVERKSNAEEREGAVDSSNDFNREMHFVSKQSNWSIFNPFTSAWLF